MDASQRTADDGLTENYVRLARAVIAQACLDYLALRYPVTAHPYLVAWYWSDHGYARERHTAPPVGWRERERRALSAFLNNGGGEMALAADRYHYVRKVIYGYCVRGYRVSRALQNGFCNPAKTGIE